MAKALCRFNNQPHKWYLTFFGKKWYLIFLYIYVDMEIPQQAGIGHFYHIFYEGCLTDHEVGEDEEASSLYPDVKYKRMDDYLRIFL